MTILIFNPLYIFFDETSVDSSALGGSETWSVQIADAFQKLGHQCFNFCSCGKTHIAKSGVIYIDKADAHKMLSMKFDFAICYRRMSLFYSLLQYFKFTDSFALMLSDTSCSDFVKHSLEDSRLKKIVTLSQWHFDHIKKLYSLQDSRIVIIPNGVDTDLFDQLPASKNPDHSMLWSSRAERGLSILTEDITPIVRKSIPDFKVQCAQYSDDINFDYSKFDVQCIGQLPKKQLYAEMSKHAVWFYPSTFDETFCITAIENMMCNNSIAMHPAYGTSQYQDYINIIQSNFSDANEYSKACNEAADIIVDCILNFNDNKYIQQRKAAKKFVIDNFTWDKIAMKFIDLAKENYN